MTGSGLGKAVDEADRWKRSLMERFIGEQLATWRDMGETNPHRLGLKRATALKDRNKTSWNQIDLSPVRPPPEKGWKGARLWSTLGP